MKALVLTAALTAALALSATAASASTTATAATDWQRVDCSHTNAAFGSSSQICRTRTRRLCRPRKGGGMTCVNRTERYCFQRPQIHPSSPHGKPKVPGISRFQNR